ncbi:MAG TPA: 2-oxoacid:acceptor oxidoreductase family protein [Miltoncostaeaceae bacterium]|nr:2-oxoacid:acceptor oxidoreductase family protein [Miltoncostaeaceae bacterium]
MATVTSDQRPQAADGPPLRRAAGRAVLDGNELIVKGALEAGVSLIAGYPGSPVAEVFSICEAHAPYLLELGAEAQLANNEAQSAAMLNGARQVPGARAMAVFKSVGAYVALDGLAIANAARPAAGAAGVVVAGDDPALSSTQVGADSRTTLAGARIPVLEPATAQELKDLVRLAFDLSAESELIVGLMCTTPQADGAGVVDLLPNRAPAVGPRSRVALDTAAVRVADAVSLPPQATSLEADILERRIPRLHAAVRAAGVDRIERADGPGPHRLGIVTAGASYVLLRGALAELGIDGQVPVLRLGLTWPVDEDLVRRFADGVDEIVVMEERAPHVEDQVRRALEGRRQAVWGKRLPGGARGFPETSGMDPDIALAVLGRLVLARPDAFPPGAEERARAAAERRAALARRALDVTPRTPTYCAGCPHRGTSSPMLEIRRRLADPAYMRRVHGRGPVDVIAHGGIGCYSMAMLPPFEEMHNLSAMGLGGATGAGAAPLVTNKHYVLVGDGTFFHGEMSTIANAIKQRQDILFIILDNKNTAMTGHQGTPASETDLMGRPQTPLGIERIVAAMGPDFLRRSDPDDRDAHMGLIERALLMDGTRVIIADKECAITSGRRLRAERAAVERERGYLPEVTRYNIVEETCENCRECTTGTGCPGLELVSTPLGEKVGISEDVCVDDGYCARIKACPSFERVTVRRSRAPEAARPDLVPPPEPATPAHPAVYRIHLAGVGGMGIGVVGRILIEAAAAEWPAVEVFHRKGLAQRGGGVFSHVTMHDGAMPRAAEIAEGTADLIVGLEPLEAARAMRLAAPDRTAAAIDTHRRPTTNVLTGAARYPEDLVERANAETRPGALVATDVTTAARRALGDARYANVAVLGAAWQRGWIPIGREAIEAAIRRVAGRSAEANLRAFLFGRVLAADAGGPAARDDAETMIARELAWVRGRRRRRAVARAFERAREAGLGEVAMRMLAPRLPEIVAWGGPAYAERYLAQVDRVRGAAPALIPAAIHNLHRTMAIKDEVFVASQLTSRKKYERDRERFGVDPSRGDRIGYVHLNRPAFDLLGRRVEWDMETRDWQLRLMSRARFLRRLLPAWHRRERAFREWYEEEVVGAVCDGRLAGPSAEAALRLPESVTGFREVRYPKEDAAYARLAELIGAGAS